jgi:cyanophycin synthetase
VINYKLEGVFAAKVPQITGDGESTLIELITEKNLTRLEGIAEVKISAKMAGFLVRQLISNGILKISDGYQSWYTSLPKKGDKDIFEFIPSQDAIVYLSEKIGMDYGGISGDEYDICHPDTLELFEKAGHIFDDTLLGFDLMIPDISRSWKDQKCGLLEANTAPFFNLHHDPFYGKPRNVAAKVWDMIDWK